MSGRPVVRVSQATRRVTRDGARLRWCASHAEPVWEWRDGSVQCPYDLIVESRTDHAVVDGLWEIPPPPEAKRRGRPPVVPEAEYQRTAAVYRAAQIDGRPTTAAVMDALGLGSSAARKRIMGARERGLLPPTNGTTRPRV